MTMKFSRDKLYNEIWEISAKQVANRYGLKYSSLLKKCKEYSIPLPDGKYWYFKSNKRDISNLIVKLPLSNVVEIEIEIQPTRILKRDCDSNDLSTSKLEIKDKNVIPNFDTNSKEYSLNTEEIRNLSFFLEIDKIEKIVSVLSIYNSNSNQSLNKYVLAYKEKIIEWNKRVKSSELSFYDPRYQNNTLKQPKFIKDVSTEQLPRLYKILDILFSLFEQFGEVITDDLSIQISKDIISFEIIESKDTITHSLTKEEAQRLVIYNDEVKRRSYVSKPKIPKYDYVPNGIFKIKLSNGKYIKDTKTIKLEDMIPETAILFYQCYFEIRNKREEYEKAQVIWEEQRRKAKELQDYINLEKVKTRDFLNILSDFKLANEIREFACVLKDIGKTDEETLQWILNKANWIDPTISMEDDLLGKRDHHKSKEEKDAFLKETRHYW